MKKILPVFLSFLFTLFASEKLAAQYWIPVGSNNITTNQQTVNDVIISNQLGIGVTSPLPTSDPLIVCGGASNQSSIYMYDINDNTRFIYANTAQGNLNVFSGTNSYDGTGLLLYGIGASQTPGLVQTVSNATNVQFPSQLSFQHLSNDGTALHDLFHIDFAGNEQLAGDIFMWPLGGDSKYRNINAMSTVWGLNLFSGSGPYDGSGIQLFAQQFSPGPLPTNYPSHLAGGIRFIANNDGLDNKIAFEFKTHYANSTAYIADMTIFKNGQVCVGPGQPNNAYPNDLLTVDGNIYLWQSNDNTFRNILARSVNGGLNITTGNSTTAPGSDGAAISLAAQNASSSSIPATDPGTIKLYSNSSSNPNPLTSPSLGLLYGNYDANNLLTPALAFNSAGDGDIGPGADISHIILGNSLTVESSLGFHVTQAPNWANINGESAFGLSINGDNSSSTGARIELSGINNLPTSGMTKFYCNGTNSTGQIGFEFLSNDNTNQLHCQMGITYDGRVFIGPDNMNLFTASTSKYSLYVQQGILTEKVRVALQNTNDWADYVFKKDYQLMPITQLASYVQENKHLPDVPSAAEVAKEGIDMAKMDAELLRKIEELTLYVIQQDKKIEELEKKLAAKSNN